MDSITIDATRQRKRVPRACDRCKLKKVKCCGAVPCTRCKHDDAVCLAGTRVEREKRMVSRCHVERLYRQQILLMKALRELWRQQQTPNSQDEDAEEPSIHDIVASTGVLNDAGVQSGPEDFDWDLPSNFNDISTPFNRGGSQSDECPSTVPTGNSSVNGFDLMDDSPPSGPDLSSFTESPLLENSSIPKIPVSTTLAARRGAPWINKCPMPSQLAGSSSNSSVQHSLQHSIDSVEPQQLVTDMQVGAPLSSLDISGPNSMLYQNAIFDMNIEWEFDEDGYMNNSQIPRTKEDLFEVATYEL